MCTDHSPHILFSSFVSFCFILFAFNFRVQWYFYLRSTEYVLQFSVVFCYFLSKSNWKAHAHCPRYTWMTFHEKRYLNQQFVVSFHFNLLSWTIHWALCIHLKYFQAFRAININLRHNINNNNHRGRKKKTEKKREN